MRPDDPDASREETNDEEHAAKARCEERAAVWWGDLPDTVRDDLLGQARVRNAVQIDRLGAVESKAGVLVGFAGLLTALLIGQDAAGKGPVALLAVGLTLLSALLAGIVVGFSTLRFRWSAPRSVAQALGRLPDTRHHAQILEEETSRGDHNQGLLSGQEFALRSATLLLVVGLMAAVFGWQQEVQASDALPASVSAALSDYEQAPGHLLQREPRPHDPSDLFATNMATSGQSRPHVPCAGPSMTGYPAARRVVATNDGTSDVLHG